MPSGSSESLQELAARIVVSTDGDTRMSCKDLGLGALTDELLVVASDALQAAVAVAPGIKHSGKALQRCLAWLVAAALGSKVRLDPNDATKAGKRLQKQATKVRAAAVQASTLAAAQRSDALAAAAADNSLADELPALLEQIDATEAAALAAPCREVYKGFYEIACPPTVDQLQPPPTAQPNLLMLDEPESWTTMRDCARRETDSPEYHSLLCSDGKRFNGYDRTYLLELLQAHPAWGHPHPTKLEGPVSKLFLTFVARDLWQMWREEKAASAEASRELLEVRMWGRWACEQAETYRREAEAAKEEAEAANKEWHRMWTDRDARDEEQHRKDMQWLGRRAPQREKAPPPKRRR